MMSSRASLDGATIFRNTTYFLEGDGPFIFVAYDKINSMFQFIVDPNWNNTDAVIDGMVAHLEDPEPERQRLKEHAWSVVCPGFEYFQTKFTVDLHHQGQLLKLACFCHPIRMRQICLSIKELDELNLFNCIEISKPLIDLTALKNSTACLSGISSRQ